MDRTEQAEPLAGSVSVSAGATAGDVVEIRPVVDLRVCAQCLVANSASDRFCTACGHELAPPVDADAWPASAVDLPAPLPAHTLVAPEPVASPAPTRGSRRWPLVVAVLATAGAGAAAVTLGLLWHSQTQRGDRLQTSLETTQRELNDARTSLRETQAKLASVTTLADKRRAVLLQAKDVLAKVDPLLSSVDNIQGKARDIQSQRDSFTTDSDTLTSTMITLGNYLINTDPSYIDGTYLQGLIDQANAELATVRADEVSLGTADSGYNDASTGFGNKADAFSSSVRGLQKQLNGVTAK